MSLECLEFRQIVGADPDSRDPRLLAHRLACRNCANFARQQEALDRRLKAALKIDVPDDLGARVIWRHAARRRVPRLAAIAATLAMAAGIGLVMLRFTPAEALPRAVVAHIEHEPDLLLPTESRAEPVRVNAVLNRGGFALAGTLDDVVHAGLCPFRGRLVPHLVIDVDGEPISVLLFADEPVDGVEEIHEDGYHGVIVPRDGGSMAVVGSRPELIRPARERLDAAVTRTAI